jgi:putative oxidoreductase
MSAPIARTFPFARVLLSGIFLVGGLDAARHPNKDVDQARTVIEPLSRKLPFLAANIATVVRLNGLLQLGAGIGLATGARPRAAALTLGASLVPTTFAGHRFWDQRNPDKRYSELVGFLANAGLLGGLLLAAAIRQEDGS